MPGPVGRVLVVRLDSDGDVLLAGPAVRAVAAGAGDVVLLAGPRGAQAAELLPGVAEVLVWRSPWVDSPPPPVRRVDLEDVVARLAATGCAEAVVLTSFHQSPLPTALLLRLARVGRITGASVDYPGSLLDVRVRPGEDLAEDLPESQRALAIAAAAGYRLPDADDDRLAVRPPPDVARLVGQGPYLVVHPGASVPARVWPPQRCAQAVAALTRAGHRVLVTGSPAERELTARVAAGYALDLGGRTTFAELAGVLAGARAVVVGNTGPAHLAAAVGTPVVSLFAPVVPARRWAPYGVACVLLGDQDAPCRDSRARACPVPGHPCLTSVSAVDVLAAVDTLLSASRGADVSLR